MILIWDNGMGYDDHGICFVELAAECPEEECVALLHRAGSVGFVLGVAEHIEWRDDPSDHGLQFELGVLDDFSGISKRAARWYLDTARLNEWHPQAQARVRAAWRKEYGEDP